MIIFKAVIVCSVLAVPFMASAADLGSIRTLPGTGDADGDGFLTQNDVTVMAQHLFSGVPTAIPAEWYLDFNEDGRVSILDVLALANVVKSFGHTMPAPRREVTVGDVDGNGAVTYADAEAIFAFLFKGGDLRDAASADVNCDNRVSLSDVIQLLQQLGQTGS